MRSGLPYIILLYLIKSSLSHIMYGLLIIEECSDLIKIINTNIYIIFHNVKSALTQSHLTLNTVTIPLLVEENEAWRVTHLKLQKTGIGT